MDVNHFCGNDLSINSKGGLTTVTGTDEGQQRVLRRLLTNLKSYLWHLDYGAGLPSYLGTPAYEMQLRGAILNQMTLEQAVQQSPPPVVTVNVDPSTNVVTASIRYVDATTNLTSLLVVPIIG